MKRKPLKLNRINRLIHYWGALLCALPVLIILLSGGLLVFKKKSDWIQPPTLKGQGKTPGISFDQILAQAKTVEQAKIKTWKDINRLDVRPSKGITKIRAKTNWEIQIDNQTGKILGIAYRRSDIIESIHDGSFFANWVKYWIFFPCALILFTLWVTGLYLFIITEIAKIKKKRKRQNPAIRIMLFLTIIPCLASFGFQQKALAFDGVESRLIFQKKLVPNWRFNAQISTRFDTKGLAYQHYDAGISRKFKQDGRVSGQFRLIYKRKFNRSNSNWQWEYRPFIQIENTQKFGSFVNLALRYRHEYCMFETKPSRSRGRFRIRLMVKNKKARQKFIPYIQDEVFYDYHSGEFTKNKLSVGTHLSGRKGLTPDLSIKFMSDKKSNHWQTTSLFAIALRF